MIEASSRAQRSNLFPRTILWIASSLVLLAMTASIATAEESFEYSPPPCEFTIRFPEEPQPVKRCDGNGERCYDQLTYTQVFDLAATVNFRIICSPADREIADFYTTDVMEKTLEAMTSHATVQVQSYDISSREEEDYRQAGLVGESTLAGEPAIYLAQLWVGQKSIFSIEGELIGETHKKADELFRNILQSIGSKAEMEKDTTEEPKSQEP